MYIKNYTKMSCLSFLWDKRLLFKYFYILSQPRGDFSLGYTRNDTYVYFNFVKRFFLLDRDLKYFYVLYFSLDHHGKLYVMSLGWAWARINVFHAV